MPVKLSTRDPGFSVAFDAFLLHPREEIKDLSGAVGTIIADVRQRKDTALVEYTQKWDDPHFTLEKLRVTEKEIAAAKRKCSKELKAALKLSAKRIAAYHRKQLPKNTRYTDKTGVTLGWQWTPLDAAGLYVPGGMASYPSSVLMNAIPAVVAGVRRLAMAVPAPRGELNPAVLAAAEIAGVTEIYRIGGAQAVAALAFGTPSIASVDKIVGPGNAYVTEAKRQVFGKVGIDTVAGPSEICVMADAHNDPKWIAADLLSQAEHASDAQSILITDSDAFAGQVENAVAEILRTLPRANIASASWEKHGAILIVQDWEEGCDIANRLAPEHLELAIEYPEALLPRIRHAGAIFLGRHTPEAVGDYIAGPSHVLPTSRAARFSSGLSVLDFLKRSSLIGCSPEASAMLAPHVRTLADAEGLQAHGLSATIRK